MKIDQLIILTFLALVLSASAASADVKQVKIYKEAFPGESPKCILCHVDKVPKKDDGKHDLNAYGKSVVKECEKPTVETYQKVGKAEAAQGEESKEAAEENKYTGSK